MVQDKLRKTMENAKTSSETPYNQLIVDQLNIILGHAHKTSVRFWTVTIKAELMAMYRKYHFILLSLKNFQLFIKKKKFGGKILRKI